MMRARLLRRRKIDILDVQRIAHRRRDAPQEQALTAPQPVVVAQERFRLTDR